MSDEPGDTLFFAGRARLPGGAAPGAAGRMVRIELEIAAGGAQVVDVCCSDVSPFADRLLHRLLRGLSLDRGIEPVVDAVRRHYFGAEQKAIVAALRNAYGAYLRFRRQTPAPGLEAPALVPGPSAKRVGVGQPR